MTPAAALLLLSIAGLLALVIVLAVAGGRQDGSIPRRRPRPYPGCCACQVADADDVDAEPGPGGSALVAHQMGAHTRGVRW
jgi:hypothetical protein